ncbi:MAG: hypothetical protein NVS4B7_09860 [Ktedonobacteraceae bacterium]
MGRSHEEAVLRITAQYVEEVQAGQQPEVSAYIARYPQYADEIADFIAYYFAVEADAPIATPSASELSTGLHIAINSTWKRLIRKDSPLPGSITTLLLTAKKQRLTFSQLGDRIGLSSDIAIKLEQRKVIASSIPAVLIRRLADVLQEPVDAIEAYFASVDEQHSQKQQVAESQVPYQVHSASAVPTQSFAQAIEVSTQLSEEQKVVWRKVLDEKA